MCGRYTSHYTWKEIHAFSQPIRVITPASEPEPSYNVAPTQSAWVLLPDASSNLRAAMLRWGLIPRWAKDAKLGFSSINARLETVDTKPTFRAAWQRHRCLVPVSGYFEWTEKSGRKQPYYVQSIGAGVLMLGGIYERWGNSEGFIDSFSIVTTEARGSIASLHDRMPIVLPPSALMEWVNGSASQAMTLAMTLPDPELAFYGVSPAVGNVRNNHPALIEEIIQYVLKSDLPC